MKITRMDLDMTGSPMGLVGKILAAEPDLPTPTPLEQLCQRFDIQEIAELTTEGFEGGLLTQEERTSGIILVKKVINPTRVDLARRRFTIAHELGHFLMLSHKPIEKGNFLCKSEDMRHWDAKDQNAYKRMEAQANEFAALLLMPPPRIRNFLKLLNQPDVSDILALRDQFAVSTEAAARSYVMYHGDPVAVVFVKDGKILRSYRNADFPFITALNSTPVPSSSNFHGSEAKAGEMQECITDTWFDVPKSCLYEQVHRQRDGYAMILLWAELPEEDDRDEYGEMTSKERYHRQQERYGRQ